MRTLLIFILGFLVYCAIGYPQSAHKLDSIFLSNFIVLDSVARGAKQQRQLTPIQASFLHVIDGWADSKTSFNHFEGIVFGEDDVQIWRQWYSRNASRIDPDEFQKAMDILITFFTKGLVPESDLDYLEKLDKKYRGF